MTLFLLLCFLFIGIAAEGLDLQTPIPKYEQRVWNTDDGLPQNNVQAILQTKDGYMWVGTQAGLVRFDGFGFKSFDKKTWPLENPEITTLFEDRNGALWVGTNGGGAAIFKDGKFTRLTTKEGLSNQIVWSITETDDGSIWLGTQHGLNRYKDGNLRIYTKKDGLPDEAIWVLCKDNNKQLWIGTNKGGIAVFANSGFITVPSLPPVTNVYALFADREGYIWIGTNYQGLFRYRDGQFTSYGKKEFSVYSIRQDRDGSIWIATFGHGICRFNNGKLDTYSHDQGLPGTGVWAIHEDREGNLWTGSYNAGLLRFRNPAVIRSKNPHRIAPTVKIETALMDDQLIQDGSQMIRGKGNLAFHYSALSYTDPSKMRFKYKLEDYDKEWMDGENRRSAHYTNLPPGRYRFKVLACSEEGVWSKDFASFGVTLKPHFYQTYMFYILCFSLAGGIIFSVYSVRHRQAKRREQELQDLVTQSTQAFREAKEAAEAANKSKSRFLANISHELRTPMNGILGMTELVLETNLTHDQKECLQMVKKSGDSLLELLNDLLDFSKIEAGKFTLVNSPFVLSVLLTDLVNIFSLRAKEKGLDLKLSISPEIPRTLQGDPLRLRQILMNLLCNAIKFTERGSVHLEVSQKTKTTNEVVLLFSVADTGIGIDPSKQELIFEAFQQVDDSSTRHFGGTGLGLAISRELVKLMQGHLWTVSAPRHGSTFYFTVTLLPVYSSRNLVFASSRLTDVTIPECDHNTLKEILTIFKESVEKQLTQLEESLRKKETGMISTTLLKLKATLSNFGENNAYRAADDLEKILKTNPHEDQLMAYELLKVEVESLEIYLEGKMHENLTC